MCSDGKRGREYPFPFTVLVFLYLLFEFIDLTRSKRGSRIRSDDTHLLPSRSLLKFSLQLGYLFEEVVIVSLSVVTKTFRLCRSATRLGLIHGLFQEMGEMARNLVRDRSPLLRGCWFALMPQQMYHYMEPGLSLRSPDSLDTRPGNLRPREHTRC